jgi:hypothetical protein
MGVRGREHWLPRGDRARSKSIGKKEKTTHPPNCHSNVGCDPRLRLFLVPLPTLKRHTLRLGLGAPQNKQSRGEAHGWFIVHLQYAINASLASDKPSTPCITASWVSST